MILNGDPENQAKAESFGRERVLVAGLMMSLAMSGCGTASVDDYAGRTPTFAPE